MKCSECDLHVLPFQLRRGYPSRHYTLAIIAAQPELPLKFISDSGRRAEMVGEVDPRQLGPQGVDGPSLALTAQIEEIWTEERCFIRELLNDEARPELSIAMARVPRRTTTRLHSLRGVHERYVIHAGRGRVEIDGVEHELGPGDLVEIPPGAPQRIANIGREDLVFFCICTPRFRPEIYEDLEADEAV